MEFDRNRHKVDPLRREIKNEESVILMEDILEEK